MSIPPVRSVLMLRCAGTPPSNLEARLKTWVVAALLTAGLAFSTVADAGGNSGAPDDELRIGSIRTFTDEHAAAAACGRDPVVWADRYAGYYYFPREPQYGHTADGAFACFYNVRRNNYWGTGPMSSMGEGHGAGRQFPDHFPAPPSFGS